ncbi:MAG: ParB/RepB/Spo0J family partition protein [Nitrososphaerales archaeon]
MVTRLNHYLRPDLIPEYVDSRLIDPSEWNARDPILHLESLMDSIRTKGLLQPIIIRIVGQRFEVVAGNRRLEACKRLHWVRIPCLVREFTDKEAFEIGLVENIERKTLSPIEEARAFQKYVHESGWGGLTELARAVGRSKEYVSHRISLLRLPRDVLDLISTDKISPSSAHELVWMDNHKGQQVLAGALVNRKLPTSKVREAVKMFKDGMEMDGVLGSIGAKDLKKAQDVTSKNRKYSRLLDKSILTLRICIVRLDSIIEELESGADTDNLKHLLIQKRLLIHNQIDELIQLKRSYPSIEN